MKRGFIQVYQHVTTDGRKFTSMKFSELVEGDDGNPPLVGLIDHAGLSSLLLDKRNWTARKADGVSMCVDCKGRRYMRSRFPVTIGGTLTKGKDGYDRIVVTSFVRGASDEEANDVFDQVVGDADADEAGAVEAPRRPAVTPKRPQPKRTTTVTDI